MKKERPGDYPFTRGIYKNMYCEKLWTMRQYAGFQSASESNKRYKYLIKNGVSGLSVAFDLPTQIGYDSDHDMADGEVGKVGVPISKLSDMRALFEDISLNKISVSMTINSTAAIIIGMYTAIAEKEGISMKKLKGTIQNDILKEYIARGTYIYPPKQSLRIVTDIFEFCENNIPNWNIISISGYHIR
ncbi:MAG: methylmalonyl-CoA mutase, partial [Candidatus Marinimicrobia bacterium]|nr:methylmalonyl-CoA mutase [Candidatus Neomarinimicrobiota bacterium]